MGAFYEKIILIKDINKGTRTKQIVCNYVGKNKEERKKTTIPTTTFFSSDNTANNPNPIDSVDGPYFFTTSSLQKILKNLPNKSSSGLYNIPRIILKHLPPNTIDVILITSNNALNYRYFPTKWKCAKLLPILKNLKTLIPQQAIDR